MLVTPDCNLRAHHPYPGPRPFRTDESNVFFGREGEILDLTDLLVSQQVVVLHAQSGAGKTSLINAGVLPQVPKEWCVLHARVGGNPPDNQASGADPGLDPSVVPNVFTANVLSTFPADSGARTPPATGLASLLANRPSDQPVLLVLDQFEELFTTHLDRWRDRETFFQELAAVLVVQAPESGPPGDRRKGRDGFVQDLAAALAVQDPQSGPPNDRRKDREAFFQELASTLVVQGKTDPPRPSNLRLLIVIREEHVARLEPFSRYLPGSLRVRYYLERLREAPAIEAIEEPAKLFGRPFSPEVAEKIAHGLLQETLHTDTGLSQIPGEFVEPALLQLVCRQLWDRLEAPGDPPEITAKDVDRFGQIDDTLQAYYERTVAAVARENRLREGRLRDWLDRELITVHATRGRALVDRSPDARMLAAVRAFEQKHIVRGEAHAGAEWCELTHDRFIAPIRASNLRWRAKRRRRRVVWIGVPMLVLLVVIAGLILYLYRGKADLQKEVVGLQKELTGAYQWSDGEVATAAYTLLAWQGLNQGDWKGAIAAAEKCIVDFGAEARSQQQDWVKAGDPAPPEDRPSQADARRIGAHRILNNVAACLFVKAKAAEHAGRYQEARAAYQTLQEFRYARVWDPHGYFWSPSTAAAEALRTLPQ